MAQQITLSEACGSTANYLEMMRNINSISTGNEIRATLLVACGRLAEVVVASQPLLERRAAEFAVHRRSSDLLEINGTPFGSAHEAAFMQGYELLRTVTTAIAFERCQSGDMSPDELADVSIGPIDFAPAAEHWEVGYEALVEFLSDEWYEQFKVVPVLLEEERVRAESSGDSAPLKSDDLPGIDTLDLKPSERLIVGAVASLGAEPGDWPQQKAIIDKIKSDGEEIEPKTVENLIGPLAKHGLLVKGPGNRGYQIHPRWR